MISYLDFRHKTTLAQCIDKSNSELDIIGCLSQTKSDIEVDFSQPNGDNYSFGWNQLLTLNGEIVQDGKSYPRYDNAFASVPWGSKVFNISSMAGHYIYMDFENLDLIYG